MAYSITRDKYFTRNQPANSERLKNRILVNYSPLIEGEEAEVYRSSEPILLGAGESIEIEAAYNNVPCINAVADIDNERGSTFSITVENHYSWGAIITVLNNGSSSGTCELYITATPLIVEGGDFKSAENESSILEYGLLEYTFPDNHLIQDSVTAQGIASALISSYSTLRKECILSWRGDPSLELGDEIQAPVYQRGATIVNAYFYIFKNQISFDGTLKETTSGILIDSLLEEEWQDNSTTGDEYQDNYTNGDVIQKYRE